MADDAGTGGNEEVQLSFKVKTSSDGMHNITIPETATVLDLKTKLAGPDFENVPVDRQRLIYSGRVLKNEEPLSTYKIKAGNTVHMVKSAASNAAQNPSNPGASATGTSGAAAGVPTNMAAGTANNPLAGLTGARYAGHLGLPGREMFGADGGMGAPPTEEQMADMLSDPATAQMMNEALNNPQMIEMMIQSNPTLRQMGPAAREMLQSPMFRQMMTNPDMLRQAARMQRQFGGGGAPSFPAPGVTDTTPAGAPGSAAIDANNNNNTADNMANPFAMLGAGGPGANPFALFGPGAFGAAGAAGTTPSQSPPPPGSAGQATPSAGTDTNNPPNPFAALFGQGGPGVPGGQAGAANPFGLPPLTADQMQEALRFLGMGAGAGAGSPPPPPDNRPPEEQYADQLRQLNDMGFFDFEANVAALRRSGGSVQGAIEQLLR